MKYSFIIIFCLFGVLKAPGQQGINFHSYPSSYTLQQLRSNNDIHADALDHIWVGFRTIGLGKYDGNSWAFYDSLNSGLPSNYIYSITSDSQNHLWVATGNGLAKFDGSNWTIYDSLNSGLPGNAIYVKSVDNIIWCGTRNGAASFDGTNWLVYNTQNSGIAGDTITVIAPGNSGEIFMGTEGAGLSRFHLGSWTTYNVTNSPLTSDNIKRIAVDGNNDAWISTVNQLMKLSGNVMYDYLEDIYEGCITLNISKFTQTAAGAIVLPLQIAYGTFCIGTIDGNNVDLLALSGVTFAPAALQFGSISHNSSDILWLSSLGYINGTLGIYSFDRSQIIPTPFAMTNANIKRLDINGVDATILNRGDMHWDLMDLGYEVPAQSGKHSVFASALWMGGLDNNSNLHVSAQTYRQSGHDYWPGPIDTVTLVADSATSILYDKIWKVNRATVEEFKYQFSNGNVTNGTYPVPDEILTWPAQGTGNISRNMAPFVDFNNDQLYNPMHGDYPLIRGDQMLYWIINDGLAPHMNADTLPLNMEVHCSAYAYTCDQLPDSESVMHHTTFYNYRIINRSMNDYHDFYAGLWSDMDMGNALDDNVGCDTVLNAAFTYNGDNDDDGIGGYGVNPPVQNIKILDGPLADAGDGIDNDHDGFTDEPGEKCLMTSFLSYNGSNNSPTGPPNSGHDYYFYMNAIWLDGLHMTYGDDGRNPNNPLTNFMYSGTPYDTSGWWEGSAGTIPEDRRFIMSCGGFTLQAGVEVEIDFAYVFTRDTTGPNGILTSVARNKADLQRVQQWFDNNNAPSCLVLNPGIPEINRPGWQFTAFPNPATELLNIKIDGEIENSFYSIYDLSGRKILSGKLSDHSISVNSLDEGMYMIMISDERKTEVKKFIRN